MASISVLDMPGFQNPLSCGRQGGATFEDLCHNYAQERLQLLFHDAVFTSQQDLYAQVRVSRLIEIILTLVSSDESYILDSKIVGNLLLLLLLLDHLYRATICTCAFRCALQGKINVKKLMKIEMSLIVF
jgi:hypothetical protein